MKKLACNLLLLGIFINKIAYSQEILEKEALIFCPNYDIVCCAPTLLINQIVINVPYNLDHFVGYERNESLYQSYLNGIYYVTPGLNIRYEDRDMFTTREIEVIDSIETDLFVKLYFSDSLQNALLAQNVPATEIKTSRKWKKLNEGRALSGYFFTCKFRYMFTGMADVCIPNPRYRKYSKKSDLYEIHRMPTYMVLEVIRIAYYIPKHKKIAWKRRFR